MKFLIVIAALSYFLKVEGHVAEKSIAKDTLEFVKSSGKAPFNTVIIGPKKLTKKSENKYNKWVACEYHIDWGDNSTSKDIRDCSEGLKHTYVKPGKYIIKANTFYADSEDDHITDWSAEATVIVK